MTSILVKKWFEVILWNKSFDATGVSGIISAFCATDTGSRKKSFAQNYRGAAAILRAVLTQNMKTESLT